MLSPAIGALFQMVYRGRGAWLALERCWAAIAARHSARSQMTQAEISQALGFMYTAIERFPLAVVDETALPFPKARMKVAFKAAWLQATSGGERAHHEVGFMLLAQFQPGVGPLPINPQILPSMPPEQVIRVMGPWQAIQPQVAAEEANLAAEWRAFLAKADRHPRG